MAKKGEIKDRTGEKYLNNEGYEVEILKYVSSKNCTVKFNDDNQTILNSIFRSVEKGWIKNPNHPTVFNVGYMGQGKYTSYHRAHSYWYSLIRRCHSSWALDRNPTYKEITIHKEWYNYQIFAQWFEENYVEGWQLDKDVLDKHSKIYSPETCAFVPQEINKLFTKRDNKRGKYPIGVLFRKSTGKYLVQINRGSRVGRHVGVYNTPEEAFQAYKIAKEQWIKEVAEKWKHLIDPRVYNAMLNYQVEITD